MPNKSILLISLRSDVGGGSKHMNSIFENLHNDFNFYIASPLDEPFGKKWSAQLRDKFLKLPHRKFSILHFKNLISFLRKNNITVIHAHGKGAGIYARLVKMFLPSVKIIFTWHGFHIESYNRISKAIYIFIEKILSRLTDLCINVSEGEQKVCLDYRIYSQTKSVVIFNGLEDEYIAFDKNALRKKLGLPENKFTVINISRFDKTKNVSAFVETAALLKDENDILFLLAGDGEEKQNILSLIEKLNLKNILLTGFITNPVEYLSASDLYLSTSLSEGLPYSLLEASMCKLPIIASDVRGNNEIVVNNANGLLFNLNNISQAADYILKLKSDSDNYERLSDNARKIFLDKFAEKKMIFKLKEVYEMIIV
ncbi:glycosyltransferase [Ignavibacterium sp.]|uniref:glycosyltransferase n=1 Tax=Ignavibacterium sp. TaxID=2651167 RepID=UPI00307DCBFB